MLHLSFSISLKPKLNALNILVKTDALVLAHFLEHLKLVLDDNTDEEYE